MGIATLLDPQVFDVKLFAVTIGPVKIRISFERRDDVFVIDERHDPFLFGPDTRAVRVLILPVTIIEQLDPGRRSSCFESLHVVTDFEQVAAIRAAIDNLEQTELAGTAPNALE